MTITANDMQHAIGATARYHANGLQVLVRVVNVKQSYGRIRYAVVPVSGYGEAWIEASSLTFQQGE